MNQRVVKKIIIKKSFIRQFRGYYFIVILVSLFFLNIYDSYKYISLIILMYFLLTKKFNTIKLLDKNSILLFLFSLSYVSFALYNKYFILNLSDISILIFPILLYISGLVLGKLIKSEINLFKGILYLSIIFSFIYLESIIHDIANYGMSNIHRELNVDFSRNSNVLIGAQIFVMGLCPILPYFAIYLFARKGVDRLTLTVGAIFTLLAVFSTLRLASRTPLIILFFQCLFVFLYNVKSFTLYKKAIMSIGLIIVFYFAYELNFAQINATANLYNRISDGSDVLTGGDRLIRWAIGFENIYNYPLGGEYMNNFKYYHNLWLDTIRIAGVITFIFLFLFTIGSLIEVKKFMVNLSNSKQIRSLVGALTLGIMMQFFSEPVIEGNILLFLFYCLFIGLIKRYSFQRVYSKERYSSFAYIN